MIYRGKDLTFIQLSQEFTKIHGVATTAATIYKRIKHHGYTVEQSVETPLQYNRKSNDKLISGNKLSTCRHSNADFNRQHQCCKICGAPARSMK